MVVDAVVAVDFAAAVVDFDVVVVALDVDAVVVVVGQPKASASFSI